MKKILTTIALVFATSALTGLAQDASSSATPAQSPAPGHERHWKEGGRPGPGGPMKEVLESLTPAERQEFMEARKKAESDPLVVAAREKVEAAMKESMEARRAAMLKADPNIGPVLDKIEAAMKAKAPRGGEHGKNAPAE